MRTTKILSLIVAGGILGFILRGLNNNTQEARIGAGTKQVKSPKRPVKKLSK